MLRTAVLIFGCLVLLLGAYLCTLGACFGGIQTLIFGAIFVLGTLFERWRYNNKNVPEWTPIGKPLASDLLIPRRARTWKCSTIRAAGSVSTGKLR